MFCVACGRLGFMGYPATPPADKTSYFSVFSGVLSASALGDAGF